MFKTVLSSCLLNVLDVFGAFCVDILIIFDILQRTERRHSVGCVLFFVALPKSFSQYKCKFPLYRKKSGRIEFRYNSIYSRNLIPLGLRLTEVVLIFAKASTMIKVNYWHEQICSVVFFFLLLHIQFNLHFICVSISLLTLSQSTNSLSQSLA